MEKAPQIGFSWTCAAEATWEALLFENATNTFTSIDQREANEKVLASRKLYEGLPERFHAWVPIAKDSVEELWFGSTAAPSRVRSIPSTSALRGYRTNVYQDESDLYKDGGEQTFRVAMGRVQRGGRYTIGSTVWGVDTVLDRMMQGEDRNFSRAVLPYVVAENEDAVQAIDIARTEMRPEDFEEEYECVRGGGSGVSFTPTLLRASQHDLRPLSIEAALKGTTIVGYDVGTTGHPSIALVLALDADHVWRVKTIEEVRADLPTQHETLRSWLKQNPGMTIVLDALGIGRHIAESLLKEFGSRVVWMQAGQPGQERYQLAKELLRALEASELELLPDRELLMQLQRSRITSEGKVEQPGSKRKTHYDRFWALAYGWFGAADQSRESVYESRGLQVIGGRR